MLPAQTVETPLCCNGAIVTNVTGATSEWMDQGHTGTALAYTTFVRTAPATGVNESRRKCIIKLRTERYGTSVWLARLAGPTPEA